MRPRTTAVLLAVLFSVLFVQPGAWAQRPGETGFQDSRVLPDGRPGERVKALIQAINSGDPARVRKFFEAEVAEGFRKVVSMEEHLDVFQRFFEQTGGVDFYGVRTYIPERRAETVIVIKDRDYGAWRAVTLRFSAAPDFLISGIAFNTARPPQDLQEAPLPEEQVLQETRNLVGRLEQKGSLSGTLLIARGEKVLLTLAGGEASKAFHVPNNIDTRFNLGSMNKMFTSTAVMLLVEKGRLSLDDRLDKFLDESWLPKEITNKITIRHLLTHSSGLGSYFNDVYDRSSRALFRKLDDYKPLIRGEKLAFEPGARYQYSNTGMFLLGVVIEKVTGEDYFNHIRKVIYEPAGMKDTDCYEMDYPVPNLAIGYSRDSKSPYGWQNNLYKHVIKGGPAGGGFSTVKDLHRFALALLGGKYVSPDSLKKMWTDQLGANYGFGFTVFQGPAGRVVGHSGGFAGINSRLDIYPDSGYIVAVMSNIDSGAGPLAQAIGRLLERLKE